MNLQTFLDEMGVAYRVSRHETAFTASSLAEKEHVKGRKVIKPVVVQADDYGRDPIEGVLAGLTPDRVTVARECGEVDVVHVHFPRAGYVLARR